jgi:hypothetical protein
MLMIWALLLRLLSQGHSRVATWIRAHTYPPCAAGQCYARGNPQAMLLQMDFSEGSSVPTAPPQLAQAHIMSTPCFSCHGSTGSAGNGITHLPTWVHVPPP